MITDRDCVALGASFEREASRSSRERVAELRLKTRDADIVDIDRTDDRSSGIPRRSESLALFEKCDARESKRLDLISNLGRYSSSEIRKATLAIHLRLDDKRIESEDGGKSGSFGCGISNEFRINEDRTTRPRNHELSSIAIEDCSPISGENLRGSSLTSAVGNVPIAINDLKVDDFDENNSE